MKYKPHTYQPDEPAQFWCHCCDRKLVDSDKPETGTFYIQFGHTLKRTVDGLATNPDLVHYEPIVYALCKECDPY